MQDPQVTHEIVFSNRLRTAVSHFDHSLQKVAFKELMYSNLDRMVDVCFVVAD